MNAMMIWVLVSVAVLCGALVFCHMTQWKNTVAYVVMVISAFSVFVSLEVVAIENASTHPHELYNDTKYTMAVSGESRSMFQKWRKFKYMVYAGQTMSIADSELEDVFFLDSEGCPVRKVKLEDVERCVLCRTQLGDCLSGIAKVRKYR